MKIKDKNICIYFANFKTMIRQITIGDHNSVIRTVIQKDGNVLFNDALITFYLQLYGIRYMVRIIQIERERGEGEMLPSLHELLFSDQQQGLIYMHHPTDRIVLTTTFVTPAVEHWLEMRNSSIGPPRGIKSATLSIRLTRLKPRDPPKPDAHATF